MAAVFGEHRDQFVADFLGQLLQLLQRQLLDVRRLVHHVEVSAHTVSSLNVESLNR